MQSSHHLIGFLPFNTTILIIFIEISPQLDLISSSRCPTSTTFTSKGLASQILIIDLSWTMTTISSYNHQHETLWINTNLNQKNITKSSTKLNKNNITTTSWKTCKPSSTSSWNSDTHFIRKQIRNWDDKKRTSAEQNGRIRASDVCREVGRGNCKSA